MKEKPAEVIEAYIEEIESALLDVLDGDVRWWDIQENTGLSTERCKEIADLYLVVSVRYRKKHGLDKEE